MLQADPRLIVALDKPTVSDAWALIEALGDTVNFYKIGLQLIPIGGMELSTRLKQAGKQVFLDYKLHDIPATVEKATRSLADLVMRRVEQSLEAGVDGIVASAHEAAEIRQKFGGDFLIVTPGIRPAGAAADDQKRVATPGSALHDGSTHLVVGRPINAATDPSAAARAIIAEMAATSPKPVTV